MRADLASPSAEAPGHRRAAPRRSRGQVVAGVLLILAGAAVLGWVAWQFWGTTWVAHRTQERVVEQLEQEWDAEVSGGSAVTTDAGTARAVLRVPRFGEDFAVPVISGVTDDDLAAGVGHFTDTAGPGEVGNFALAAHRITHGEPFRDLPSLEPGDEVVVETRSTVYTYVLDTSGSDLEVSFDQGWVLDALPTNPDPGGVEPAQEPGQRLITLTTCAELFHTDERLVAFGHLVGTAPR